MRDSDLVVVFDLLHAGFEIWSSPAFFLIFIGVGLIMIRYPRRMMELTNWTKHPKLYKFFSWVSLGFAIFMTVLFFTLTYRSYTSLRDAYIDGNFEVVEGPVENFQPIRSSGRLRGSFTVAGQGFSYSDNSVTPGFKNTYSHLGPISAGVYVRIFHINGQIVRLEMERSAAEAATIGSAVPNGSSNEKIRNIPEGRSRTLYLPYTPVLILLIFVSSAVWRWRGRIHIARDPSLREGYNRMTLGFAFWASFPLLVGAILSLAQELRAFETVSDSWNWSFWLDFPQFVSMLVIAKWVYWT